MASSAPRSRHRATSRTSFPSRNMPADARTLARMARLEHAAIAVVLLVGFVADLRFIVPCVLGVVLWWLIRHRADRVESAIGVVLLAASTLSFAAGNEV